MLNLLNTAAITFSKRGRRGQSSPQPPPAAPPERIRRAKRGVTFLQNTFALHLEYPTNNMLKFSNCEKTTGKRMYLKFIKYKKNPKSQLISFKQFWSTLDKKEIALLKKIISIDPKDYGKNYTVFHRISPAPKDLVRLSNQKYYSSQDKKIKKVRTQFLPHQVYIAFKKMRQTMNKEIGTAINVTSGYRSPAYQTIILFIILFENKWNLRKTLRRVTLPGCSEHGYPKRQAIDVAPEKGIKKLEDFAKTKEFKWLQKNAGRFSFKLPFPKGNKFGVMFEPWHWEYAARKK